MSVPQRQHASFTSIKPAWKTEPMQLWTTLPVGAGFLVTNKNLLTQLPKRPAAKLLFKKGEHLIHRSRLALSLLVTLAVALAASQLHAQSLKVLASFDKTTGYFPRGSLTLSGSTLYGMGNIGGANDYGTIFSVPVTGGTPTVITSFDGTIGAYPSGSLTLAGSTFYGTTTFGGVNGEGSIFSIPVIGGTPTLLGSFDVTNGKYPVDSLTLVGSTLYGMTQNGGAFGRGVIYSLPVTGGTPATLLSFDGTNGWAPGGVLTVSTDGSTFYGMTSAGGVNGKGNIFSIPVAGGTPMILASFNGTDGRGPQGGLTLVGSTLYGTTRVGGTNDKGTVFSIPVTGGTITTLLSFDGTNGRNPYGDLTVSGSTLYGMASEGGANDAGTIFGISITGGTPAVLASFNPTIGENPLGSLTLSADGLALYGMTWTNGPGIGGTVFAMPVPEPSSVALLGLASIFLGAATVRRRLQNQVG